MYKGSNITINNMWQFIKELYLINIYFFNSILEFDNLFNSFIL